MTEKHAFMLAAPASNSGKTLLTMGLIHLLVKRGLKVQAFKCGPDYIDPMYHSVLAGRPSYNLDLWMAGEEHVKHLFQEQSESADLSVVEGVMGLFDGADGDRGSSAHLARILNLPVVLVLDASGVAHSVAPLLYGFRLFDSRLRIAGVIFNKVASEAHFRILERAAGDAGVRVLGHIPRDEQLVLESRHLGLHMPEETAFGQVMDRMEEHLREHLDIDALLKLSPGALKVQKPKSGTTPGRKIRIAMASDEAFCFSYRANLDVLGTIGELHPFSPIRDPCLPEADLVWLPGGYPELFCEALSSNSSMMQSLRSYVQDGKALVAECGGMMYLGNNLVTREGKNYPMCRVFGYDCSFEDARLHLGYRELDTGSHTFRGHEFHYSTLKGEEKANPGIRVRTARGQDISMPVYRRKNCWGSYMHLYLGEAAMMKAFLEQLGL